MTKLNSLRNVWVVLAIFTLAIAALTGGEWVRADGPAKTEPPMALAQLVQVEGKTVPTMHPLGLTKATSAPPFTVVAPHRNPYGDWEASIKNTGRTSLYASEWFYYNSGPMWQHLAIERESFVPRGTLELRWYMRHDCYNRSCEDRYPAQDWSWGYWRNTRGLFLDENKVNFYTSTSVLTFVDDSQQYWPVSFQLEAIATPTPAPTRRP